MKLYYYKDPQGNFGDDMNPWLWDRLLPDLLDDNNEEHLFVAIGTVLSHRLPQARRYTVFGSGVGYGDKPNTGIGEWDIRFVRGPLSAEALQLGEGSHITDPAILVSEFMPEVPKQHKFGFVPHHDSVRNFNWEPLCIKAGIHYISPQQSPETAMREIASCEVIIAEAMHGAIIADSFRIPWIPVRCYPHILDFKWRDWCLSMGLDYRPTEIPSVYKMQDGDNFSKKLKTKIKRYLKRLNIWSTNWTEPPPMQSRPEQIMEAEQSLLAVTKKEAVLSDQDIFDARLKSINKALDALKSEYAKP